MPTDKPSSAAGSSGAHRTTNATASPSSAGAGATATGDAVRKPRTWHGGHEEIVVAAVLLVVLTVLYLGIDDFVRGREGAYLGPKFWPSSLLLVGMGLSLLYLVLAVLDVVRGRSTVVTAEPPTAPPGDHPPTDAEQTHRGNAVQPIAAVVLLALYIYLLGPIGFVPATALFSVAFLLLVGERRWWVLVLFPVVALTVLIGVFTQLLPVSLPRGTGFLIDLSTYLY